MLTSIPAHVIKAIGNTLIHSLWQGLILAAVAACIIVSTRKRPPAQRYNLLIASLALFAVSMTVSFVTEINSSKTGIVNTLTTSQSIPGYPVIQPSEPNLAAPAFKDSIAGFIDRNVSIIVLVWFLIVCMRGLQLATGLLGLRYYRRQSVMPAPETWQKKLQELALQLGITRPVAIAESAIANVPMVIGHLKPLILVPAGLLAALPANEIEAILVHELAHIFRRDYIVNLLQSSMEILFFFNPAVLWISALIKVERENCCDDIAVAQTSNKVNYIKALVACQEYQLHAPAYAMALQGRRGGLTARVKRILSNNNKSLNGLERALLFVGILFVSFFVLAFPGKQPIKSAASVNGKWAADSTLIGVSQTESMTGSMDSITYQLVPDAFSLPRLQVCKPSPPTEASYQKINHTNHLDANLLREPGNIYQQYSFYNSPDYDVTGDQQFEAQKVTIFQPPAIDKPLNRIDGHDVANSVANAKEPALKKLAALTAEEDERRYSQLQELVADRQRSVDVQQAILNKKSAMLDSIRANNVNNNRTEMTATPVSPMYTVYDQAYRPYEAGYPTTRDERQLIAEMVKDGIIKSSKTKLSFKLSDKEFIVNGERQPPAICAKYRAGFVPLRDNHGWAWMYNFNTDAQVAESGK
ncbi:MAG: M56 family metallopeptidase [Bacteroidota bacterium]